MRRGRKGSASSPSDYVARMLTSALVQRSNRPGREPPASAGLLHGRHTHRPNPPRVTREKKERRPSRRETPCVIGRGRGDLLAFRKARQWSARSRNPEHGRAVDKHQLGCWPALAGNGRSRRSGTCRLLLVLAGRGAAVPRGAAGVPRRTRIVSGRAPALAGRASGVSSRPPRLARRTSGVPGRAHGVARRGAVLARCGAVLTRRLAAVAPRPWSLAGRSSAVVGRRYGVTGCASGVPRRVRSLAAGFSGAGA
jgi:hypothetical protein